MNQDLAYLSYLRRLDARAILEHYGAERQTEQTNKDGSVEIKHSCLLDRVDNHHANGDANPSACINLEKNQYVCYSLGGGMDLLRFVMAMEGAENPRDAIGRNSHFLTESVVPVKQLSDEIERVMCPVDLEVPLPSYDPVILNGWDQGHPYWAKRGITPEIIEMFRLGYDSQARRVTFPHFVNGELTGWQKRVIPGETMPDFPKYRSSPGMPKSETLYGVDLVDGCGAVIVVESPMSVVKAYSLGMDSVVATFGAKVSNLQVKQLRDFDRVIVWMDTGPAGQEAERRLLQKLYRHTETYCVVPDRRDLGDFRSLDEVMDYIGRCHVPAAYRLGQYDQLSTAGRRHG